MKSVETLLRRALPHASEQQIEVGAYAIAGGGERLGRWWLANPELVHRELVEHFTDIVWVGFGLTPDPRGGLGHLE